MQFYKKLHTYTSTLMYHIHAETKGRYKYITILTDVSYLKNSKKNTCYYYKENNF